MSGSDKRFLRLASDVVLALIGIGLSIDGYFNENIYEAGLGLYVFLYGLVALLRYKKILK